MGKGSNRRPCKVTPREFMENWERVFGKSRIKDPEKRESQRQLTKAYKELLDRAYGDK